MQSEEMRSRAEQCEEMAQRVDLLAAPYLHRAAEHWRGMAEQMELLEGEAVYRIIRNSLK